MQAPQNRLKSDYACRLGLVQSYCRFRGSCNRVRSVDLPFRLRLVQIHVGFLEAGKRRMQFAAGLCRFIVGSAEPVTGSAIQTSHFAGGLRRFMQLLRGGSKSEYVFRSGLGQIHYRFSGTGNSCRSATFEFRFGSVDML